MRLRDYKTMKPLLLLLERLWGPLENRRVLFGSSWSVVWGSWMRLGDSLGAYFGDPGVSFGALGGVF